MLHDYKHELTELNGLDVDAIGNNATVYGGKPYDLKAAGVRMMTDTRPIISLTSSFTCPRRSPLALFFRLKIISIDLAACSVKAFGDT